MSNLTQFSTDRRFIEDYPLEVTHALLPNNETTKDLVYTTSTTVNQPKNKVYYVRASMPYNQYSPTAFLFKIRSTIDGNGVKDPNILDYENDTHQVVKYAETPYSNLGASQTAKFITCSYEKNLNRYYNTYTYHQLIEETSVNNISPERFNNILEDTELQKAIIKYIQGSDENAPINVSFDIQELDNSSIDGLRNYIIFDFIFISKIPWNQFICCYDRRYSADKRILNGDNSNVYVKIYPFKENSDFISRDDEQHIGLLPRPLESTVNKISLRVFDEDKQVLKGIPFYINNQGLKTGPDGEYTLKGIPIYNFGIPNYGNGAVSTDGTESTGYTCVIEYEYD